MRVALVCPYSLSWPGGVQSHVLSLARYLAAAGHHPYVLAPIDPERRCGGSAGVGADEGGRAAGGDHAPGTEEFPVLSLGRSIPIPANKSVARLSLSPGLYRRIAAHLSAIDPDVVHVHEPLQAGVSLLTLLQTRLPASVGSFHAASERMVFYAIFRRPFRRLLEKLDVVAAVSPVAANLVTRYFGNEVADRLRILPNGIDYAKFAGSASLTDRSGPQGGQATVLFVGRLEPRKGCDLLLEAWRLLRQPEAYPAEARLVIVGDGPLRRRLEDLASTVGGVEFRGRISDNELIDAYRTADVVCVPSVQAESFGVVLLEAMAAGAAVVASDLAGYRWVAEDAALYFRAGDVKELRDALARALADGELRSNLASRGRVVARKYDWKNLLADVVAAYEDAVRLAKQTKWRSNKTS